jgi:hypothetical protein
VFAIPEWYQPWPDRTIQPVALCAPAGCCRQDGDIGGGVLPLVAGKIRRAAANWRQPPQRRGEL